MKTNTQPKLHISLSKEHNKYQSDVTDAFKGFDISFDNGLMRFSSGELPMQIILSFGGWVVSNIAWDLLKSSIGKIYKKFTQAKITVRDSESIMFTIKPDLSVSILVVPDRTKEFEHIKTFDDLIVYFKNRSNQKNDVGWQLIPVGDVFTFVKSYAFSRDNLSNGILSSDKIGNIHYGDIHATFTSENIDLSKVQIPIINEVNFSPKQEDLLIDGDLIMADASEDYDGIGVTVSVHGIGKNKVVGGLHTFVLRDEKGLTSEYYRQYIFLNKEIRNQLQKVANGVSVYGISKTALSKMELHLPSLSEQNRIVLVLETWDQSIDKLSKKIEIKKQIKKGLMQDLLTGKKRLEGFKENWKHFKIGEICKTSSGGTPRANNETYYLSGNIPWLNSGELRKGRINSFDNFITKDGLENSSAKVFPVGTVLVAMYGATAGQVGILEKEASTNQAICGLLPNKNYYSDFIYFLLSTKTLELLSLGSGAAQPNISQEIIRDYDIFIPSSLDEQIAITKIISTSDKEIQELEKKLSIIKEQKRYLLNNLITGTIRTPETLSTKLTK